VQSQRPLTPAAETPQTIDNPEVYEFLFEINLHKYYAKFTESSICDLQTILKLKDDQLDAMGIPLGYKLKILKQIKTKREQLGL
jgi:hypothetical protein